MYIADMHCDSLSCVSGERGLINSYNFSKERPQLQFFAHFSERGDTPPQLRRKRLMHAYNVYLSECERLGLVNVTTGRDLFTAEESGRSAAMFTVEGGAGLFADSPELDTLARGGLRILGLAWDANELSCGAWEAEDTGLTDEGRKMVLRASELGMILDLSHLSDRAFYEVFELSGLPHVATHSNYREVCPSRRNLTRDMAKKIASRGGVIGVNIYPPFLRDGGEADISDILRHIDYALELFGCDDNIGFGFDIDGVDKYPIGIDEKRSIHDQITESLTVRYGDSTARKIAGLNVLDFLKNNLI